MWSEASDRWLIFAADVFVSADEINREYLMSSQIKGLAETVRRAKSVLAVTAAAGTRLESATAGLAETVANVDAMTGEIVAADNELRGVVDALKDGAAPLDQPENTSLTGLTMPQAQVLVHEANRK